jgi:hypothetical protein
VRDGDDEFDSPLQSRMRTALSVDDAKPAADLTLREGLLDIVLDGIGDAAEPLRARLPDAALTVGRIDLANVLACESHFVEGSDPFSWDVRKARGRMAFTTIRRWYLRGPRASDISDIDVISLVEEVIDQEAKDSGTLGVYLREISETERADLVAEVSNVVYAFVESWPNDLSPKPFKSYVSQQVYLLDRRLRLINRVSFRFGRPYHNARKELVAGAVFLDIRSGQEHELEERANRFLIALLETLASRVPPAKVVTWYAESQELMVDDIEHPQLEAAARRVGDAVRRIVELHHNGRRPGRLAGWRCSYCRLLDDCAQGQAFRSEQGF